MNLYKIEFLHNNLESKMFAPILRLTYKTSFNKFVKRDIVKNLLSDRIWIFIDNGEIVPNVDVINAFILNDLVEFTVNK